MSAVALGGRLLVVGGRDRASDGFGGVHAAAARVDGPDLAALGGEAVAATAGDTLGVDRGPRPGLARVSLGARTAPVNVPGALHNSHPRLGNAF